MQPIFASGTLPSMAATVIYTVSPGGAAIDVVQLTNITAADVVVNVEVGSGAAVAKVAHNYTLSPDDNSIAVVSGKLYLAEGATITVTASAADAVSYLVNGIGGFFDGA